MNLYYEVILRDKQGKVIAHLKSTAKSWLKQWSQLVYGGMSFVAQSVLDTNGVSRTQSITYDLLNIAAPAGNASLGVVAGTGTDPVTINDYRLQSQIVHGVGVGQLNHQATEIIYPPLVSGSECYFLVKRILLNQSGGIVSVNEIGVYGAITSSYPACIIRDVLAGTVNIPDGGSITVIYRVKAVV
jgi:hypothetical protein